MRDATTKRNIISQHFLYKSGAVSLCPAPAPTSVRKGYFGYSTPRHILASREANRRIIQHPTQMTQESKPASRPTSHPAKYPGKSRSSTSVTEEQKDPRISRNMPDSALLGTSIWFMLWSDGHLVPHGSVYDPGSAPKPPQRRYDPPVYAELTTDERRERFIAQSTASPLGRASGSNDFTVTCLHGVLLRFKDPETVCDDGPWMSFYVFKQSSKLPVISSSRKFVQVHRSRRVSQSFIRYRQSVTLSPLWVKVPSDGRCSTG